MADTSRSYLRIKRESTFGTQPTIDASNKADTLRIDSHSLQWNPEFAASNAIRPDRAAPRGTQVGGSVGGDIVQEFLAGAQDGLMSLLIGEAANLASDEEDSVGADSSGFEKTNHGLVVGDVVRAEGFSGAIDGFYRVTARPDANNVTCDVGTGTLATDSASAGQKLIGKGYKGNGLTQRSFFAEVGLADASDYFQFLGCRVGSLDLSISAGGIITATYTATGKEAKHEAQVATDTHSNSAATGRPPNAADDVHVFIADDVVETIQSLSLNINNNARARQLVGVRGAAEIPFGTQEITGSVEFITDDFKYYDDMLNRTARSLTVIVGNAESGWYAFDIAQFDFQTASVPIPGASQDVVMTVDFSASIDEDDNYFRVSRGA